MINLTNDSWYGNTLEPEQHLFLARWRAIEFKLPILRATNTGVSVFLDAHGQEVERINYGISDNLDLKINIARYLSKDKGITYFQKWGFFSVFAIWCLCFIFQVLLIKLRHAKNN
jgi:apolipoprotein N-acyltransferase